MRDKYFGEDLLDRSYFQSYKSVLNSKATEEVLVSNVINQSIYLFIIKKKELFHDVQFLEN